MEKLVWGKMENLRSELAVAKVALVRLCAGFGVMYVLHLLQ